MVKTIVGEVKLLGNDSTWCIDFNNPRLMDFFDISAVEFLLGKDLKEGDKIEVTISIK